MFNKYTREISPYTTHRPQQFEHSNCIEPNTSSDHMTVNTTRDTKINNNNVNENKKSVIWDRNA